MKEKQFATDCSNDKQKYKELNEKDHNIAKLAQIGVWEYNLKDDIFYCSEEMYNIYDLKKTSEPPLLEQFTKKIHPRDYLNYKQNRSAFLKYGKSIDLKYRIILADKTIKWIHERGQLVKNYQSTAESWQGIVQDVTLYNDEIQHLIQKEELNQSIIKNLTRYVIRTDEKGFFIYHNKTFFKDFGNLYGRKFILGENSYSILTKFQRNKIFAVIKKGIAQPNKISKVEIQISNSITILWTFKTIVHVDGSLQEIQGYGIDISKEVNAKKSLREINERYNLACKATSEAIWDLDLTTNSLFWGEGFFTLFGYEFGTFSQNKKIWESNIHPDDYVKTVNQINIAIESSKNYWISEYRFKKSDGTYAYVVDRCLIFRNKNNMAIRLVGSVKDVTKTKNLEQLLEKVSKQSRIGSFEIDFKTNDIYWSAMARELLDVNIDFSPDFSNFLSFFNKGTNHTIVLDFFKNSAATTSTLDVNVQITTATKRQQWIRVIATKEFVDGKINKIFGSFQDIDKITTIEYEIKTAIKEKELILESIGNAFFAINYSGTITYWNKNSEELLKLTRHETINKNIFEVFPKEVHSKFYDYFQICVQEKKSIHFELHLEKMFRWFDVAAYPGLHGISVYFNDISKRKKNDFYLISAKENMRLALKKLTISNQNLEQFSYIVSHNLRAPLANISGLIELLEYSDDHPEKKVKLQKELKNNVFRLDSIIRDLNNILKLKSTNLENIEEVIHLETLIKEIQLGLENLIKNKQLQIKTEFNDIATITTVRAYLYSIFLNLMSNSVKYSRAIIPVQIEIFSEATVDGFKIIYKDNGMGIDIAKKGNKVFGLYQRFHNHVEGKGMGLFMVKTQIELIGGQISISSEVDKGTTFILEFKNKQ